MKHFRPTRVTLQHSETIPAPAAEVFPLLCPEREHDWIDGWSYDLLYSDSGIAENNCVFTTRFPRGTDDIWIVSRYEPENFIIQFVVVTPGSHVMKMDVSLRDTGPDSCSVAWTNTFTSLTEKGTVFIENSAEKTYRSTMTGLSKALEHYCRTGKMLKKSAVHKVLQWAHQSTHH